MAGLLKQVLDCKAALKLRVTSESAVYLKVHRPKMGHCGVDMYLSEGLFILRDACEVLGSCSLPCPLVLVWVAGSFGWVPGFPCNKRPDILTRLVLLGKVLYHEADVGLPQNGYLYSNAPRITRSCFVQMTIEELRLRLSHSSTRRFGKRIVRESMCN
jgi:hypothetical protein